MEQYQHRLERRTQENYLPREALEKIPFTDKESPQAIKDFFPESSEHDRFFSKAPDFFKSQFKKEEGAFEWQDDWFKDDNVWPEMTRLAEKIA